MNFKPEKTAFGRHESFALRYGWLTKGFQAFEQNKDIFSSPDAIVTLGVGKNMVNSIRHWLRAARLADIDPDKRWLESLLLFLANKPAKKWSDIDRDGVDLKLAKYSRRFLDLRRLQLAHEKQATRHKDFDIILVKAMRHGKTENERAVLY